jgi:hypothetical protein
VTYNRAKVNEYRGVYNHTALATSYYALLGLHPSASVIEIRRAYRELSKRYHPDTTELPASVATEKFQKLNEAYATLSNPERREAYDQTIRYSRIPVVQASTPTQRPPAHPQPYESSAGYLDPTDRPLSAGEVFALFILGLTFIGCLILAIAVGLTRGEAAFQPVGFRTQSLQKVPVYERVETVPELTQPAAGTISDPE